MVKQRRIQATMAGAVMVKQRRPPSLPEYAYVSLFHHHCPRHRCFKTTLFHHHCHPPSLPEYASYPPSLPPESAAASHCLCLKTPLFNHDCPRHRCLNTPLFHHHCPLSSMPDYASVLPSLPPECCCRPPAPIAA